MHPTSIPHSTKPPATSDPALKGVASSAGFGPVGRHPWVNEAGKVDAAKAGTWTANIILMAGGSAKTAFACALEVATDITDNPAKFKDFEPWPNVEVSDRRAHATEIKQDANGGSLN